MKTIQPVNIWANGVVKAATIFQLYGVSDNLKDSAVFFYALLDSSLVSLAQGNITMNGTDYENYQSNQYAWDWAATTLNLTITGDYIPTTETN